MIRNIQIKKDEINISFLQEDKKEGSTVTSTEAEKKVEEKNLSEEKKEGWLSFLKWLSLILTVVTLGSTVFYFVINTYYKVSKNNFFSFPKEYFNLDISEYVVILGVFFLAGSYLFPGTLLKKEKDKIILGSSFLFIVLFEFILVILNMKLWSRALHNFFRDYSMYKESPEVVVNIFLCISVLILILINMLILKEDSFQNIKYKKLSRYIVLITYGVLCLFLISGKEDFYDIVTSGKKEDEKGVDSKHEELEKEIDGVIVGYHDGEYVVTKATVRKGGEEIVFKKNQSKKIKKEDVIGYKQKAFRKAIFEE